MLLRVEEALVYHGEKNHRTPGTAKALYSEYL